MIFVSRISECSKAGDCDALRVGWRFAQMLGFEGLQKSTAAKACFCVSDFCQMSFSDRYTIKSKQLTHFERLRIHYTVSASDA